MDANRWEGRKSEVAERELSLALCRRHMGAGIGAEGRELMKNGLISAMDKARSMYPLEIQEVD